MAIDYFVHINDFCFGIQVKPHSFFKREQQVYQNAKKHAKLNFPVYYHVYSNRTFDFLSDDTNSIQSSILNHCFPHAPHLIEQRTAG